MSETTTAVHVPEHGDDGIATLTLDIPGTNSNNFSLALINALHGALDELQAREGLVGLILRSTKNTGFAVGADSAELERMLDPAYAATYIRRGQALTCRIAALPVPTVALLHGSCRGVGLELAIACRYRLAADAASTALCLPDVMLDQHCGFGGSARLADLIGGTPALAVMETGRVVTPEEARQMGLVDGVHAGEELDAAARSLLQSDPGPHRPKGTQKLLSTRPVWWLLDRIRQADDLGDTAPEARVGADALRTLWRDHGGGSLHRRLRAERSSVLRLLSQPPARNRIRLYAMTDRYMAESRRIEATIPGRVHVIGAGALGSELVSLLVANGFRVSVQDLLSDRLDALRTRLLGVQPSNVADGEAESVGEPFLAGEPDDLASVDLVVEAIDENADLKRALFEELEGKLGPEAVIASTTSTVPLASLAGQLVHPTRLVGLRMIRELTGAGIGPVVEVAVAADGGDAAARTAAALVAALDRMPLYVKDCPGGLLHRLLLPYVLAGAALYSRSDRELVDGAGRYAGMTLGPLELADWIGLDTCVALAEQLEKEVPAQLRDLVDAGHLGQRTGHGFHDWRGSKRVTASPPQGRSRFPEIADLLMATLREQALACSAAGLVAEDDLIDVVATLAAGVPGYTGGPLNWARQHQQGSKDD